MRRYSAPEVKRHGKKKEGDEEDRQEEYDRPLGTSRLSVLPGSGTRPARERRGSPAELLGLGDDDVSLDEVEAQARRLLLAWLEGDSRISDYRADYVRKLLKDLEVWKAEEAKRKKKQRGESHNAPPELTPERTEALLVKFGFQSKGSRPATEAG